MERLDQVGDILISSDYTPLIDSIWKANKENAEECARQSLKAFPLPPIMKNLEIMSNNQYSKLLADTQKRGFYLGALAMAFLMAEMNTSNKQ